MTSPENQECGIRIRFDPVQRDRQPNRYSSTERLIHWCRIFDEEGLAPRAGGASAGNLSFRTPSGFVVTPTRASLKGGMGWGDLVEVVRADWQDYTLHFLGVNPPSSDSFLHEKIYVIRPDVRAVFHGHDDAVLKHAKDLAIEFDIAFTPREIPFGTSEDAQETGQALGSRGYIIRKGHGFVSVGESLDEAGEFALKVHRRAMEMGEASNSP